MIKDLSAKLIAAVTEINQQSRKSFATEQQEIATKKAASAKMHTFMPKQPGPKADPAAVSAAKKMAEEAEGTVPKTPREKELAAKHGNKKLITHGDVMKARGIHREEAIGHAGKVTMKHVNASNASPQVKAAIKKAAPDIKSYGDRAAALNAAGIKREEFQSVRVEGFKDIMKKIGNKVLDAVAPSDDKLVDNLHKSVHGKNAPNVPKPVVKPKLKLAHDYVKENVKDQETPTKKPKVPEVPEWKKKLNDPYAKEKSAFNSKQISTGTVYTRKYEEVEQQNEAKSESDKDFKARQERLAAAAAETAKDPVRLKRMMSIPGYSAAMGLANKTTTKEEVETLDELSKSTLGSYVKKATRDATITRKIGADFEHQGNRAKSPGMKAASNEMSQKYKEKSWKRRDGVDKAVDRLTKEEVEQQNEAILKGPSRLGFQNDRFSHLNTPAKPTAPKKEEVKSVGVKHEQFGAGKTLPQFAEDLSWIDVMFDEGIKRVYVEDLELTEEKAVHPDAIHVSNAGGGKYKVHAVGSNFSHGIKVGEHLTDTHLDDFSEMGGKIKTVKAPKKD